MNIASRRNWPLLGVIVLLVLGMARPATAGWPTNTPLPALKDFDLEGALPGDLAGKVMLVDFWASWCGPCKASFPVLESLNTRFAGKGLVVIGVCMDEQNAAMKKFLATHPVTFTIVRDHRLRLMKSADVPAMPTSFIVDRKGVIRFVHSGFHGEKTARQYESQIEALLKEAAP